MNSSNEEPVYQRTERRICIWSPHLPPRPAVNRPSIQDQKAYVSTEKGTPSPLLSFPPIPYPTTCQWQQSRRAAGSLCLSAAVVYAEAPT